MRLLLIALGWGVAFCALSRAIHLAQHKLLVRASMVVSWAILAAGATLLQMQRNGGGPLARVVLAVGIAFGAASFIASRLTHGTRD